MQAPRYKPLFLLDPPVAASAFDQAEAAFDGISYRFGHSDGIRAERRSVIPHAGGPDVESRRFEKADHHPYPFATDTN
jgi:hypothetical protein